MTSLEEAQLNSQDTQAVNNLREYLKIPSVHPNINYDECLDFLKKQAKSLDLPIKIHYVHPQKPVAVITWLGTDPTLASIMLNSHMDVVPVFEDKWTHKPFSAHIDEKNNIYGRGSQDMKSVGIIHLEAIRRLKEINITLKRTIHLTFVPDEETGGELGMKKFVQTKEFQDLNVGVLFDEGLPMQTEEFVAFYGERCRWHFLIHCPGKPGHGSLLFDNTAGEKVSCILNKIYEFRKQQGEKLKNDPNLSSSDVTSINLTKINGGVQSNVIPPEFILTFDCRITPSFDFQNWEKTLNEWCRTAGEGVWIEFIQKDYPVAHTKLENNMYWDAVKEAIDKMGLKLKPVICPGVTDARFIRALGIPAFGFSPFNNTPILLHNHNEHLGVKTFLKGVEIFSQIIISVGNKNV